MASPSYYSRGTPYETSALNTPGAATLPAAAVGSGAGDLLVIFACATGTSTGRTDCVYPSTASSAWHELEIEAGQVGGFFYDPAGGSTINGRLRVFWRIADGTASDNPPNLSMLLDSGTTVPANANMIYECARFLNPDPVSPFGAIPRVQWTGGNYNIATYVEILKERFDYEDGPIDTVSDNWRPQPCWVNNAAHDCVVVNRHLETVSDASWSDATYAVPLPDGRMTVTHPEGIGSSEYVEIGLYNDPTPGSVDGYYLDYNEGGLGNWKIYRTTNSGSYTQMGSTFAGASSYPAGTRVRFTRQGSNLIAELDSGGTGTWVTIISTTDATHSGPWYMDIGANPASAGHQYDDLTYEAYVASTSVVVPAIWGRDNSLVCALGVYGIAIGAATGKWPTAGTATQWFDNQGASYGDMWFDTITQTVDQTAGGYTTTLGTNSPWGLLQFELVESSSVLYKDAVQAEYVVEIGWSGLVSDPMVFGSGTFGSSHFGGIFSSSFTDPYDDVSDDVEDFTITRGRDDPFTDIQSATCDVVLFSNDGTYNPQDTTSPIFGQMLPMREVRIRAYFEGEYYGLFRGFIRDIDFDPVTRRTTIHCEDLFLWLSRNRPIVDTSGPTGSVIQDILTGAGFTVSALTDIDITDGDQVDTFTMAGTFDARTALQGIFDLLEAERGAFFMTKDGKAKFRDRNDLATQTSRGVMRNVFQNYRPGVSIENVINIARVTKTGGVQQIVEDTDSQDAYGPADLSLESAYLVDDTAALALANYLLFKLKDPTAPVWDLPFVANFDGDVMRAVLSVDILDRITVFDTAQPGLDDDFYIESMTHHVKVSTHHEVSWKLSRRTEPGELFTIGQSTLGGGDILSYY